MPSPLSQLGNGGTGLNDGTLRALLQKTVLAFDFTDVPAISNTQIVAATAGTAAVGLVIATQPTFPRNVKGVFAASYDGGNLAIVGVDQFGKAQTETITAVANSTVQGVKCWKRVDSITRSAVGVNAATVSVGVGVKIGIPIKIRAPSHLFTCDGVSEAVTIDATYHTYTATTAPDGAHDYKLLISPS